jgi:site-specific DNA recombinase
VSIDPFVRLRLLPVIRLSLTTDNTTSPERQFENIQRFAEYKRHELVPITEADYDLDVSGAVSPFDRPGLGKWLKPDMLDKWDALVVAKLDRISRSLFDFTTLVHFLEAHGKSLIILDPQLDLTTKEGRAMANVLMTFAEYEREVIGARVKEAHDKLVRDGKYTGRSTPFGYRQVKFDKNWGYEIHPEYGPIVREMAQRYLSFETLGSIVKWLRETGVPSPRDVNRLNSSNPKVRANLKNSPWTVTAVRIILTSMACLGAVTGQEGKPMRDDQGMVIYRADPLLADDPREARDIYERLQARFAQNPTPVRVNSSPLLQVAFCAACGAPMHRVVQRPKHRTVVYEYAYYQCHNTKMRNGRCLTRRVKAEPLEEAVFGTLLELAGHRKLRAERVIPGRDYSEAMARIIEQTQHLQAEIGRARLRKDREAISELQSQLDNASAELDRIADLDPEPARLEYDETHQTFLDWWDSNDQAARNAFLRDQGVKIVVSPDPLPEDLVLARTDMIFSVSLIERPGIHAVLYLGNLSELLSRADDLPVTVKA